MKNIFKNIIDDILVFLVLITFFSFILTLIFGTHTSIITTKNGVVENKFINIEGVHSNYYLLIKNENINVNKEIYNNIKKGDTFKYKVETINEICYNYFIICLSIFICFLILSIVCVYFK